MTAPSQALSKPAVPVAPAVTAMLEARTVALVGASARAGSLGARMIAEVARSPSRPRTYLVNPRYGDIEGTPCLPSLAELPEPVDLVLLAVPDSALEAQLDAAARSQARSAVIFGSAFDLPGTSGLRDRLAAIASQAGMAVCGAGCMGFVNVARGLRAVGYVEPDLHPGPVALVTHSGSVFSALLRARRGFGFSLAVSSGQELVTTAAAYARYALSLPETRVLALVLEAIRDPADLRAILAEALAAEVPAVLFSVGASEAGKALVSAHSGALAAADGAWEALAGAYGLHRVRDLAELADTLELFSAGRGGGRAAAAPAEPRASPPCTTPAWNARMSPTWPPNSACRSPPSARRPGTGWRRRSTPAWRRTTRSTCGGPAVTPSRCSPSACPRWPPTRRWPRSRWPSTWCPSSTATSPTRGRCSPPPRAPPSRSRCWPGCRPPSIRPPPPGCARPASRSWKAPAAACSPCVTCSTTPSRRSRRPPRTPAQVPGATARRWRDTLARHPGGLGGAVLFDLLRDYGIPAVRARQVATRGAALAAAATIGYPVVLKTDEPGIAHKSDVGGVRLGLGDPGAAGAAYDDLAARLGPRVLVCETAPPGAELALGIVRDAALGPLLVISAGGVLIEIFAERAVLLAPVTRSAAVAALGRLRLAAVLAGTRGQPPADLGAIAGAITGLSRLACDLGDALDALDINPLICGPSGAIAADALLLPRRPPPRDH